MTPAELLILVAWSVVALSLLLTLVEVLAAWIHFRRRRPFAAAPPETGLRRGDSDSPPLVSILKPLCGLEDGLEENLRVFATLDERFETIFSVADADDPVIAIVQRILARDSRGRLHLVVGDRDRTVANPKVERLIAAEKHARGEIIMISDAQVRLGEADLLPMIELLRDRSVGCVSHLFTGAGARNLGALVESTHLLSFVVAGNAAAALARVPCLVGKSMALSRTAFDRIGGFRAFADVLAEDQAIALALRRRGYRTALAPSVVANYVERKTVAASFARQVRWNKIRYSFSRFTYAGECLAAPGALAAVAGLLSAAGGSAAVACLATVFAFAIRSFQIATLARLTNADRKWAISLFAPLADLLQLAAWFVPFFSDQVNWRGTKAKLGRGTVILPLSEAA